MPANHRPYARAIPLIYIFAALAVLGCVGRLGIQTLMVQQQLKQGGERLNALRKKLADLNTNNDSLQTTKDLLTSIPALEKAIRAGVIKLQPIDKRFVINVPATRHVVAAATVMPDPEGGR
jgi:cell division protein FtsB